MSWDFVLGMLVPLMVITYAVCWFAGWVMLPRIRRCVIEGHPHCHQGISSLRRLRLAINAIRWCMVPPIVMCVVLAYFDPWGTWGPRLWFAGGAIIMFGMRRKIVWPIELQGRLLQLIELRAFRSAPWDQL